MVIDMKILLTTITSEKCCYLIQGLELKKNVLRIYLLYQIVFMFFLLTFYESVVLFGTASSSLGCVWHTTGTFQIWL